MYQIYLLGSGSFLANLGKIHESGKKRYEELSKFPEFNKIFLIACEDSIGLGSKLREKCQNIFEEISDQENLFRGDYKQIIETLYGHIEENKDIKHKLFSDKYIWISFVFESDRISRSDIRKIENNGNYNIFMDVTDVLASRHY